MERGAGKTWLQFQELLDRQIESLVVAAIDALAPTKGEHILDIGCAYGYRPSAESGEAKARRAQTGRTGSGGACGGCTETGAAISPRRGIGHAAAVKGHTNGQREGVRARSIVQGRHTRDLLLPWRLVAVKRTLL